MDRKRRIEVSASTLVDLKAELYKKQAEFRRSKLQNETLDRPLSKLNLKKKEKHEKDTLGKSNPGLKGRISKDVEESTLPEDDETRKALEASRKKLEEKAILYDKLMSGAQLPDEEEFYMVDFQRKVIDEIEEKRHNRSTVDDDDDDNEEKQTNEDSEDWVDYTDSLGRSRRCLKRDLPSMISMDEDLKRRNHSINQMKSVGGSGDEDFIGPMPKSDTVEEVSSEPTGPSHYQTVQNNEVRNHGVGYFAFSTTEEERQKQLEHLNSLRNQTQEQRERHERIKMKRKNALKARLDKVKRRKKLQNGEVLSDEDKSDDDDFDNLVPSVEDALSATVAAEPAPLLAEKTATKVRPWDKGKIGVPGILQPFRKSSQKEYVDKRRDERAAEFAPPPSYQVNPHHDRIVQQGEPPQAQPPHPAPPPPPPPFFVDVSRPPPNYYPMGRFPVPPPPPTYKPAEFCDPQLRVPTPNAPTPTHLDSQPPVPPLTTTRTRRDPVEEMHEFFKKTWEESLLAKRNSSSSAQQNANCLAEENVSCGKIPLPP